MPKSISVSNCWMRRSNGPSRTSARFAKRRRSLRSGRDKLWSVIIGTGAAAAIGRIRFKRIGGFCTGSRVEHNLRNDDVAERKQKILYVNGCFTDTTVEHDHYSKFCSFYLSRAAFSAQLPLSIVHQGIGQTKRHTRGP